MPDDLRRACQGKRYERISPESSKAALVPCTRTATKVFKEADSSRIEYLCDEHYAERSDRRDTQTIAREGSKKRWWLPILVALLSTPIMKRWWLRILVALLSTPIVFLWSVEFMRELIMGAGFGYSRGGPEALFSLLPVVLWWIVVLTFPWGLRLGAKK